MAPASLQQNFTLPDFNARHSMSLFYDENREVVNPLRDCVLSDEGIAFAVEKAEWVEQQLTGTDVNLFSCAESRLVGSSNMSALAQDVQRFDGLYDINDASTHAADGLLHFHPLGMLGVTTGTPEGVWTIMEWLVVNRGPRMPQQYTVEVTDLTVHKNCMCDLTEEARPLVNFVALFHFQLEFTEALRDQYWGLIYAPLINLMSGLTDKGQEAYRSQRLEALSLINSMLASVYNELQPSLRTEWAATLREWHSSGSDEWPPAWPAVSALKAFFEFYLPLVRDLQYYLKAGADAVKLCPETAPTRCAEIFDKLFGEILPMLGTVAGWWGKCHPSS
jgi:hypothetical protein